MEFNNQNPNSGSAPSRLTASIEQVAPQAKRINKLVAMAELGEGQEKETAQRYLNKKAKEFGMDAGELSSLYQFSKATYQFNYELQHDNSIDHHHTSLHHHDQP